MYNSSDAEVKKASGVYEISEGADEINTPAHYVKDGIECIDAIKGSMTVEEFKGYLKGNVMKYMWRYQDKEKALQDLKKGQWYLERLIKEVRV